MILIGVPEESDTLLHAARGGSGSLDDLVGDLVAISEGGYPSFLLGNPVREGIDERVQGGQDIVWCRIDL